MYPSFRDAMEAIEEGSADYAVLPIENSSAGPVTQVYDLLVEFENYIVGETVLPIKHMLAGVKGTTLSSIERVYSHPQGLMQTSHFLDEHGTWQQISVANTSMAAKKMWEDQVPRRQLSATNMQQSFTDWISWQERSMTNLTTVQDLSLSRTRRYS